MANLASLIAILGSGYAGYVQGTKNEEDRAVQKEREQAEREERAYTKSQRDQALTLQQNLKDSQQDITPGVATDSGQTYTDPALVASDNRENAKFARQEADNTGQPVTAAPTIVASAQQPAAVAGINSQASRFDRAAQVYAQAGKIDEAKKYQDFAKQAKAEGSDKLLSAIQSAAPSLADLKKAPGGVKADTIGAENADIFNKTGGQWTVSPDTKVEHYIDKDAAGREFVNSRVLGKDGAPVVDSVKHAQLMLSDLKTRIEAEQKDQSTYQTGRQLDETAANNLRQDATARRGQDVTRDVGMAHVGIAKQELALHQAQFNAGTPFGQIASKEKVLGRPMTDDEKQTLLGIDKLSQTDRLRVNSLLKEQDQESQAQAKAMADGMWQPGSEGAKALAAKQTARGLQLEKLLAPYQKGGGKADQADPLGILATKGNPASKGVTTKTAAPAPLVPAAAAGLPNGSVDISQDPVLTAIAQKMQGIDGSDPANAQLVMALGKAKNDRLAQLQNANGSLSTLVGG